MSAQSRIEPRSYFIRTYGCQMNVSDSEHVAGVLERAGFSRASSIGEAGLVVVNTCSVRESAENKAWGQIERLCSSKRVDSPLVAVCGCMAERLGKAILGMCPGVDLVFGLDSLDRLPDLIRSSATGPVCDLGDRNSASTDSLPSLRPLRLKAWVPVSHGCDNFCAYCIVPFVRGRERSRAVTEIIDQISALREEGVVEVCLLGQNVNSYGSDLTPRSSFSDLLDSVSSIEGLTRVKFETSHPKDLSVEIVEAMACRHNICEYLHLPVQSGSDSVLAAMKRGYDRAYYLERVRKARSLVDHISITSDIIVGYPSETEEDFQKTLDLVSEVRFTSVYMFMYSPREGTEAARLGDPVERRVKSRRFEELARLQNKITASKLSELVGDRVEVLVERAARRGDLSVGRTRGNQVVLLPKDEAPVDSLVEATVTGCGNHALRGRVQKRIL